MGGMTRKPILILPFAAALACCVVLYSCTAGDTSLLTMLEQKSVTSVSGFSAVANSASQVTLTWTKPSDSQLAGLVISRNTGTYPTSVTNGTQLSGVVASNGSFVDTGLSANTRYYYAAWTYSDVNGSPVYSSTPAEDWADTTIGSNVTAGLSTYGYVWEYLNSYDNGVDSSQPQVCGYSGAQHLGVLKFDTSGISGKPITSATLSFSANSYYWNNYYAHSLDIGQITGSWSSLGSISWLSPSSDPVRSIGLTVTTSSFTDYASTRAVTVDITAIAKAWASGTANYGLVIQQHDASVDYSDSILTSSPAPTITYSYEYE